MEGRGHRRADRCAEAAESRAGQFEELASVHVLDVLVRMSSDT